ncbi:Uncharacterised protein [Kingella potus]|uniref:Uncharacterized protein n=1 Tax=Kingella potus TaxID=265175 RepID=A0A377R6G1_9NEIS|nr:hypothetical protein [Kingella potus]UOO99897.1 hypothetical protein LVJ84_07410 [Kingella potus]STR03155.1 Uncharacterised protein [Kingella potus]
MLAVDPASGSEAVLFDGALHGYNAMLCDEYSPAQIDNRPLQDLDGRLYQIRVSVFYNIDYEE